MNHYDFSIVGGGCFGLSTALALRKEWPEATVVLFDDHETDTASKDISKIVRTPYIDPEYILLAKEAKEKWENKLPYSKFYRRSSWIQVIHHEGEGVSLKSPHDTYVSPESFFHRVGAQNAPELEADEALWLNADIGIVDSALALDAISEEAVDRGVVIERKTVARLLVEQGLCCGLETSDGHTIMADTTIIAAGPWTPSIFQKSSINLPKDLHQPFFTVAAVGVAKLALEDDEYERFHSMPILVSETGEVMPPSGGEKALKVTSTNTFTITHPDELGSTISAKCIDTNRAVLEKFLPEMKGRELNYWACPDLMTPYQHPIIDRVPNVQGLHVATAGNYHSYKFLTILGDMVVLHLREVPHDPETVKGRMLKRWGWYRPDNEVSVHEDVVPKV